MGCITLAPMTRALCRQYCRGFESDPAICEDPRDCRPFCYSDDWADAYFDRQAEKRRVYFAVMENGAPVGEVLLKNFDRAAGVCTLSVHLQNDAAKGRGIGSRAERLALAYAFWERNMRAVRADALLRNARRRHVMEKVGFRLVGRDDRFADYELCRADYERLYPGAPREV